MRNQTSLDGQWGYAVDEYNQVRTMHSGFVLEEPKHKHVDTIWPLDLKPIHVPGSWNMQIPELFHYHGNLIYQREFNYGAVRKGRRVRLCFEGSYYRTDVYLNGKHVGSHLGGFTPFSFDITGHLKRRNTIQVMVDSSLREEWVPTTLTDWFNYGGIFRSVYLEELDVQSVRDHFIRYEDEKIVCDVYVDSDKDASPDQDVVKINIPELGLSKEATVRNGRARSSMKADPELWSPANPKLYDVSIKYGRDEVKDEIGFRSFEARNGKFFLNGEQVKLKGVSLHEEAEPRGRALNSDDRKLIFDTAEELSLNFIRLAHYPHSREMAKEADRRGIMLWEEIPVYWFIQFDNRDTYNDAANQLTELITRDRNRASVVMWSVANETPEYRKGRTDFISKLAKLTNRLDGTRPVTAAIFQKVTETRTTVEDPLAEYLDVIGINQYGGWYGGSWHDVNKLENPKYPDKPIIISEFGGGAKKDFHGTKKFTEEYQRDLYRNQLKAIGANTNIHGATPWILFDFRSPNRINIYQNGFNRKGLVDADRKRKKLAFFEYKKWNY